MGAERGVRGAASAAQVQEVLEGLGPAVVVAVAVPVLDPGRVHAAAPERMSLAAVDRVDVPGRGLEGGVDVGVPALVARAGPRLQAVLVNPDGVAGLGRLAAPVDP